MKTRVYNNFLVSHHLPEPSPQMKRVLMHCLIDSLKSLSEGEHDVLLERYSSFSKLEKEVREEWKREHEYRTKEERIFKLLSLIKTIKNER